MSEQFTKEYLKELQSYPLDIKVMLTKQRIREWVHRYGEDGVYVSFSGGKDSTVLLHIAREIYPDIQAVFINTGLEFPSVSKFAKDCDNVIVINPQKTFVEVLKDHGYPVVSKEIARKVDECRSAESRGHESYARRQFEGNYVSKNGKTNFYSVTRYRFLLDSPFRISHLCCNVMKKNPAKMYEKETDRHGITAQMAIESKLRRQQWLNNGCNGFDMKRPMSNPMSFWTEQDVLRYIAEYDIKISDAYGDVIVKDDVEINGQTNIYDYIGQYEDTELTTTGCHRTGCVFCLFGIRQDFDKFLKLKEQEPKLYEYVMRGGEWDEKGMWIPGRGGLGYWFVCKWLNVHGKLNIQLPDYEKYESQYGDDKTAKYLKGDD